MRFVRFDPGNGPRPGVQMGETIHDVSWVAPTMEELIERGPRAILEIERRHAQAPTFPLSGVTLLAPIQPASLRDFLAFEDHAKAGAARRGEELNPAWYERPVYYKGNHRSILGPDEPLVWPAWTERLDFELELACVLWHGGRDLDEDEAAQRGIFGYTIMNDWSARDVQRAEMAMRLGPARSKDFATSLGPCIVTTDEFSPGGGISMRARVDGEVWFEQPRAQMHWTFPQMISYVSAAEDVFPGDVYGSGTSFGGCGLDLNRWIARGSVVELEIDGIGTLSTRVVPGDG